MGHYWFHSLVSPPSLPAVARNDCKLMGPDVTKLLEAFYICTSLELRIS